MRHNIWLPDGAMDNLRELSAALGLFAKGGAGGDFTPSLSGLLAKLASAYQTDPVAVAKNLRLTFGMPEEGSVQAIKASPKRSSRPITDEEREAWMKEQQAALGVIATCALCHTGIFAKLTENVDYFIHPEEHAYICRSCAVRHKLIPQ